MVSLVPRAQPRGRRLHDFIEDRIRLGNRDPCWDWEKSENGVKGPVPRVRPVLEPAVLLESSRMLSPQYCSLWALASADCLKGVDGRLAFALSSFPFSLHWLFTVLGLVSRRSSLD